jgi:hypothetical protein
MHHCQLSRGGLRSATVQRRRRSRRAPALAVLTALALAASLSVAAALQSPNIIIKVKGGRARITNNLEPSGGCETSTCKLAVGPHQRLTLKARPAHGFRFKRWEGPCINTRGYKCTIEGSNHRERFVVRLGRR